jgi:hypothetical protein
VDGKERKGRGSIETQESRLQSSEAEIRAIFRLYHFERELIFSLFDTSYYLAIVQLPFLGMDQQAFRQLISTPRHDDSSQALSSKPRLFGKQNKAVAKESVSSNLKQAFISMHAHIDSLYLAAKTSCRADTSENWRGIE